MTQVELIRIGIGATLLIMYASVSSHLHPFYGEHGWVSLHTLSDQIEYPWIQSVLFYLREPYQLVLFHLTILLAITAFTLGWRTSWVKWIVLAGHLSYVHRNPTLQYGVDNVLSSILFLLCLAPIGQAISLDRLRAVGRARRSQPNAQLPVATSRWGFACRRLMQIQLVLIFFFSATEKLAGQAWRRGYAIWVVLTNHEYAYIPVGWLAEHFWLTTLLAYGSLIFELAYPFLVWGRATRPYILVGAVLLHLGIGIAMGLYMFSFVMIVAHLAFVRQEWLESWARRLK